MELVGSYFSASKRLLTAAIDNRGEEGYRMSAANACHGHATT